MNKKITIQVCYVSYVCYVFFHTRVKLTFYYDRMIFWEIKRLEFGVTFQIALPFRYSCDKDDDLAVKLLSK